LKFEVKFAEASLEYQRERKREREKEIAGPKVEASDGMERKERDRQTKT